MTDPDPWSVQHPENCTNGHNPTSSATESSVDSDCVGFEDSFTTFSNNNNTQEERNFSSDNNKPEHQPLPDSQTYLKSLERKLSNLKKNSKLVDALTEKRNDCLRSLVQSDLSRNGSCNNDLLLELEASIGNTDSAVHNLYRQIQPIQPVTVGETVHIVNYDQLEEQRLTADEEAESFAEEEASLPASR
ncbi:uncharacterized protein LOC106086724 [Stomoxys calcitrans]|uniref:uncharacterized protein LOC106086724 n=1 Tax=Stomoxys calcitrans TaxID=35570 RepID=UPI0027E26769|nr:uncharacterized protein LOC106086724 [Stomoxys calcitrans]